MSLPPFVAGQRGTPTECLVLYATPWHEGELVEDAEELSGKKLLCDCGTEVPCVADVLRAERHERLCPEQHQPTEDESGIRASEAPRLLVSKGALCEGFKRPAAKLRARATALLAAREVRPHA